VSKVPLRQHVEALAKAERRRLRDLREADERRTAEYRAQALAQIHAAAVADRDRVALALESLQKQLAGLNELRKGVATSDQVAALDKLIDETRDRVGKIESIGIGRAGGLKDYVGWIVAAVTVCGGVVGIAAWFLTRH